MVETFSFVGRTSRGRSLPRWGLDGGPRLSLITPNKANLVRAGVWVNGCWLRGCMESGERAER